MANSSPVMRGPKDDTAFVQHCIDLDMPLPPGRVFLCAGELVVSRDYRGFVACSALRAGDDDPWKLMGQDALEEHGLTDAAQVPIAGVLASELKAEEIRAFFGGFLGCQNTQLEVHEGSSRKVPPAGPPGACPGSDPEQTP